MRVLYITQEYAPLFADGGLGLVSQALPAALDAHHGLRHDIVLPYYTRHADRLGLRTEFVFALPAREVAGVRSGAEVHRLLDRPGPGDVYLIRADAWYDRPGIYRDDDYAPFADETQRAAFFGGCVADWLTASQLRYDLVHGTDWQSGAALAHLRHRFGDLPQLLTILNGLYQGDMRSLDPEALGLPAEEARRLVHEADGEPSMLLLGLRSVDAAVTCSPTYASELLTQLDGSPIGTALQRLDLAGITLGVDERLWDPAAPGRAQVPFDAATVDSGKRRNKRALQERLSLHARDDWPVLGIGTRMVHEKGSDLLIEALAPLLREGRLQLVLIGPATSELSASLREVLRTAPGFAAHAPRFDQELAWLMYAGADLTVMPSRVEPCGLNQLIAYRYGTLPVVSPVGGLRDTVVDLRDDAEGSGFVIPEHTAASVRETVLAAVDWMGGGAARLTRARRRVMAQDWSWARAAGEYAKLYSSVAR